MSRGGDSGTWEGEGLRREVFFFCSRGVRLYGSLYAATEVSRPFGVVACNSWGVEADRCDPLQREVALAMARLGGAGLVFHYPGYADSYGDLAGLSLADLSEAASDAVAEASRRCPDVAWALAGFMLGASVACLAQREAGVEPLLLVQPALSPASYFQRLVAKAGEGGMAYGYPNPSGITEHGDEADAAISSALEAFAGEGAIVSHLEPSGPEAAPERFEHVGVPGTWRFGSQNNPKLAAATVEWLDGRTRG